MALEECKNRVWHKKFFFPRLLKLLPFSNKYCWCCIFILLYFWKYQELNKSLLQNFFSPSMLLFFLCFIFFFNRKVRGFSCEKMLLNWTWPVSIPEYLFHGKSGETKNEGKRSPINILCSPWKFFSYCVKKKRFWKKTIDDS